MKKKSMLTGGKQKIVLKQRVLKNKVSKREQFILGCVLSIYQIMNDKEGDVNTKLIKSLDDIGPGRIVYIRADGMKFRNHLANFRGWMEEKDDELEKAEMSDSSSKEKLSNKKN